MTEPPIEISVLTVSYKDVINQKEKEISSYGGKCVITVTTVIPFRGELL